MRSEGSRRQRTVMDMQLAAALKHKRVGREEPLLRIAPGALSFLVQHFDLC